MGKDKRTCSTCGHKSTRHDILRRNGQRVCLNFTCPCINFLEKKLMSTEEYAEMGRLAAQKRMAQATDILEKTDASSTAASDLLTKCENCDHHKLAHIDHNVVGGVGACHHGTGCQCLAYETPFDQAVTAYAHTMAAALSEEVHRIFPDLVATDVAPDTKIIYKGAVHNTMPVTENDPVNHPSHYTAYRGIEIIQLTRQMNFNRGNAVKYIARAGLKDKATEEQDLEKAIWYLTDELKYLRGEV